MVTRFIVRPAVAAALSLALLTGVGARAETAADLCPAESRKGELANCEAALERSPGDVGLRRAYAYGLLVAGHETESLDLYRKIAGELPEDPIAQYDFGMALITLHRFSQGADVMARAIALEPDYLDAQMAASMIFTQLDRREEAFRATKRAAELGNELMMFELAESYRVGYGTESDHAEAFRWLSQAAERGHVTAMEMIVEAYLNGGYGVEPDHRLAEEWAWRLRQERGL